MKFIIKKVIAIVVVIQLLLINQVPGYGAMTENRVMKSHTIELVHGEGSPTHAIIWLHGLGATANDFPPIVPELKLRVDRSIRFIFPQAPNRAITINQGMVMPGWYDIKGMSIADKEDSIGFAESQKTIEALIQQQVEAGIPSDHILLAGFSQGGAVAYYTALRSQYKLGGIIALSTYLPFAELTAEQASSVNKQIPILSMHGTLDPVVPIQLGQKSVEALQGLGYSVKWYTYSMPHSVVPEQILDIGEWINRQID